MEISKPLLIMVDDNLVNLRMGKILLSKKYTVAAAPSAQKLFEFLKSSAAIPNLVLLDIDMPGKDGFEVIEYLKADPRFAKIPVIFLTAHSEDDNVHKGLHLGAVDYIKKPYEPQLLLDRVEKALRKNMNEKRPPQGDK